MTAEEFLKTIEQRGLLPGNVIANIRAQVERSIKIFTPESLATLLVNKHLLTAFQAEQLLADQKPAKSAPVEEELGLAPLDDLPSTRPGSAAAKAASRPASPPKEQPAAKKPAPPPRRAPVDSAAAATQPIVKQAIVKQPTAKQPIGDKPKTIADKPKPAGDKPQPKGEWTGGPADPGLGPLDDLLSNPLLSDASLGLQANPLMPIRARRESTPKWLWFAGAGLILMIGLVVTLIVLNRSNGDPEWLTLDKDYQEGKDQDLIFKLGDFLERYPHNAKASLARVYLGMARLRQVLAAKGDWEPVLTTAHEVLPQLVMEPEFTKVRDNLAKMLPDMAVGLVQQAKDAAKGSTDELRRRTDRASEGLALAEDWRFVPDSVRPWSRLQGAEDDLALLQRKLDLATQLDHAADDIRTAVAAGNVTGAFDRREQLLRAYPELHGNATFESLVPRIAQATAKQVIVSATSRKAETKEWATPSVGVVTLATSGKGPVSSSGDIPTDGSVVCVLAQGSAYGLGAKTGNVLWRRYVGADSFPPLTVAGVKGSGFILADMAHRELLRVSGSGQLVWRQPLEDPITVPPREIGGRMLVATRSGRLAMIDAANGELICTVKLPVPAAAPPAVSADGSTLYLPADRQILYLLSAKDLSCLGVFPLGHENGTIRSAPVVLDRWLIVAENRGLDDSVLEVLAFGTQSSALNRVQEMPLVGRATTAAVADQGQFSVATDQGEIGVYALNGPAQKPLVKVAEIPGTGGPRVARFAAIFADQLQVAGDGVTSYDLHAAAGSPAVKWQHWSGDVAVEPFVTAGKTLIVARRRNGLPGVWIAALTAESGETVWEIGLGVPLAGGLVDAAPAKGSANNVAISALGDIYNVEPVVGKEVTAWPQRLSPNRIAAATFSQAARLADGQIAVVARRPLDEREKLLPGARDESSARLVVFVPPPADSAGSWSRIYSPWSDIPSSPPVAIGDGLMVAGKEGQVFLIDPRTGEQLIAPFQAPWEPAAVFAWRRPGVVPAKLESVVMSNGRGRLFRLGIEPKPLPHWAALAEAKLAAEITTGVAVIGGSVFAADDAGNVTAYNLTDLKPAKSWPLEGAAVWGPERVGSAVLFATERELYCFDGRPEMVWHQPLAYGAPVGMPLEHDEDIVLASADGVVWRMARATGVELGKANLGEPLAGGPISYDKYLILPGADGTLHLISPP